VQEATVVVESQRLHWRQSRRVRRFGREGCVEFSDYALFVSG